MLKQIPRKTFFAKGEYPATNSPRSGSKKSGVSIGKTIVALKASKENVRKIANSVCLLFFKNSTFPQILLFIYLPTYRASTPFF